MQTPTHLLIAFTSLSTPKQPVRNSAIFTGALLPDLSIYALFLWSKVRGIPEADVWNKIYWQDPWQGLSAVSNSIPLWATLLIIGIATRKTFLWVLAAAALLHLGLDFPVHHDDAHKHFWPLSDWRFHSPFSYWDPAHHGRAVAVFEAGLGVLCAIFLWFRFETLWVRSLLVVSVLAYAAVPVYFALSLG